MKSLATDEYGYMARKLPLSRHLSNQRKTEKQWDLIDADVTPDELRRFQESSDGALAFYIERRFLMRQEVSEILKTFRKRRKEDRNTEYYAFLQILRDQYCVPILRDRLSGICTNTREKMLERLRGDGLFYLSSVNAEESARAFDEDNR